MTLGGQVHDLAVSEKGNVFGFTLNWRQPSLQNWFARGGSFFFKYKYKYKKL